MYINMKSHKLSIRLVSCILGFFLLIQSIYIPVYAAENPNVSEPNLVTLIDAKNTSGNPRTLRIEFIAPVRFADNNPSVIILASGSSNPDADGDIQQTFLVESENSCIAVDAEMIAGYSYASQYNLTFENNLGRTGVVHITGDSSDGKESCEVAISYEIQDTLFGAMVVSPTQVILFFNFDSNFLHDTRVIILLRMILNQLTKTNLIRKSKQQPAKI